VRVPVPSALSDRVAVSEMVSPTVALGVAVVLREGATGSTSVVSAGSPQLVVTGALLASPL
jgi:hypothetical protein